MVNFGTISFLYAKNTVESVHLRFFTYPDKFTI